jgi:nucleoside permease NupC
MVKAIGAIVSNLISFVAIFSFLDASIAWFLSMLGVQNAGFSLVLKYVFFPFALVMGVDVDDCLSVAKLLGIKTFINEFVAYKELGDVINFRNEIIRNGTFEQFKTGIFQVPENIDMIWEVQKDFYNLIEIVFQLIF